MMNDLTGFLLARIAEDEDMARHASRVRETKTGDAWTTVRGRYGVDDIRRENGTVGEAIVEAAAHIARYDPARVLAECEAKRRIVEAAALMIATYVGGVLPDFAHEVLASLALPYAEHPDYRAEWRP